MGKAKEFRTKFIAGIFAAVMFVVGFLFLDKDITGNAILNHQYSVDVVSLIGLLLVLCSAILAVYIIKK